MNTGEHRQICSHLAIFLGINSTQVIYIQQDEAGLESNTRSEPSWLRRWHGKSHPNAPGEIWILICRMCALVYVAESF